MGEVQSSTAGSIVADAADAIIFADRDGQIVQWNFACEALFGLSAAQAIGRSLDLIIPEHLREPHWRGYRAAMESGKTRNAGRPAITRALRADGQKIYVEMTFAVVLDESRLVAIGSVAVARDVTRRVEEERARGAATKP